MRSTLTGSRAVLPSSVDARAPGGARGFSLLEVLVAFVVLSLTLAVIMRIFSQGMSSVSESEQHARAVMLAESKLALLGVDIPLEEGETSGDSADKLHWRIRLAAYDPDKLKAIKEGQPQPQPLPVQLLQVEVEVSWGASLAAPRSLRLVTLKLAPRPVI